jgi:hypothetical protein
MQAGESKSHWLVCWTKKERGELVVRNKENNEVTNKSHSYMVTNNKKKQEADSIHEQDKAAVV